MPKIPQYNRQVKMTTQAPSAKRSESFAGSTGQEVARFGATLGGVFDKYHQLQTLRKVTEAETFANKQMDDLTLQLQKEKDTEGLLEKYNKQARRIRQQAVEMIPDREARIRFAGSIDKRIQEGQLNIQKRIYKKELELSENSSRQWIDDEIESMSQKDSKYWGSSIKGIYARINQFSGITGVDTGKWKESVDEQIRNEVIAADIENYGYDTVLKQLRKGEKGRYGSITSAGQRSDMLEQLEKQKKTDDWIADEKLKEEQENNFDQNVMPKILNGSYQKVDLDKDVMRGAIAEEDAKAAKTFLDSKQGVGIRTDYEEYNELKGFIVDIDTDKAKVRRKILTSKKLSAEDREELIDLSYKETRSRKDAIIKNEAKAVRAWGDRIIGGSFTEESLSGVAKGKINELVYRFHKRVTEEDADPERIEEIKKEVISEYVYARGLSPNLIPTGKEEEESIGVLRTDATKKRYKQLQKQYGDNEQKIFEQMRQEGY